MGYSHAGRNARFPPCWQVPKTRRPISRLLPAMASSHWKIRRKSPSNMQNLWTDSEAAAFTGSDLALRVFTSRLLGRNPNSSSTAAGTRSVKSTVQDFFGNSIDVLYIKGSGGDLATIGECGSPRREDGCAAENG